VPAFLTAVAISPGVAGLPRTTQGPRTYPSRSVTAIGLLGEILTARETAWLMDRLDVGQGELRTSLMPG
jgi:hypothetical protein